MPDLRQAYHDTRLSMSALARACTAEQLATMVPATPDWTVKDLVGHVTAIARRLSDGRVPADLNLTLMWDEDTTRRREEFVAEEVDQRQDMTIEEILAEWDEHGAIVEEMIGGERAWPEGSPMFPDWVLVTDCAVHHHDLRGALGVPGDRDSLATGLSLRSYVEGMRFRVAHEGLPTLRIQAGSRAWVVGDGEPVATVAADPFELARAASGRRAPEQVRAFAWDGDPEPFLVLFYPYGLRESALVE